MVELRGCRQTKRGIPQGTHEVTLLLFVNHFGLVRKRPGNSHHKHNVAAAAGRWWLREEEEEEEEGVGGVL